MTPHSESSAPDDNRPCDDPPPCDHACDHSPSEPSKRATHHDQRKSARPCPLDALRRLLRRLRVQQLRRRRVQGLTHKTDKQKDNVGNQHTRDHRKK